MPPSATDQQLAEEIRQTNRSLAEAVAALRAEGAAVRESLAALKGDLKAELESIRGDLKTEAGKIHTSLAWMKGIAGIIGVSLVGLLGMTYQAGNQAGQIESAITALQKTTEEIRSDLKDRDKSFTVALEEVRKSNEEIRIAVKGQAGDMAGLRSSIDRLTEAAGRTKGAPR